jgi:hypothetical protein
MAFLFRLETTDGMPAKLPTLTSAVPNWSSGDNDSARRHSSGAGRRAERLALPRFPAHSQKLDPASRRASRSSSHVLDDKDRRLVGVLVSNIDYAQRPACRRRG